MTPQGQLGLFGPRPAPPVPPPAPAPVPTMPVTASEETPPWDPPPSAPPPNDETYPAPGRTSDLDAAFWAFHEKNPRVYAALLRFAREALAAGKHHLGIGALYERARWELWMATSGDEEFKLNNNYRSRYARLLMHQELELRGAFELRELRS